METIIELDSQETARRIQEAIRGLSCSEDGTPIHPAPDVTPARTREQRDQTLPLSGHSPSDEPTSRSPGEPRLWIGEDPQLLRRFTETSLKNHLHGGILLISPGQGIASIAPCEEPIPIIIAGTHPNDLATSTLIRGSVLKEFPMRVMTEEGITEITFSIMEACRAFQHLLIIIDLGAVDPASSGLPHTSPGGLTSRELIHLIQKVTLLPTIRGAAITWPSSPDEPSESAIRLVAKIAAEIIGRQLPVKARQASGRSGPGTA